MRQFIKAVGVGLILFLLSAGMVHAKAKVIIVKDTAPKHKVIYQAGAKMIIVKK